MKKVAQILVVVAFALGFSYARKSDVVTVKFDKFKQKTTLMTERTATGKASLSDGHDLAFLVHRIEMVVGFSCDGEVSTCSPKGVELLFVAHTSNWVWNGSSKVTTLLIDNKPVDVGKADWDGTVVEADNLVEYLDTNIDRELLEKLSQAKTVEVQIGEIQFALTDANLDAIHSLSSHLK
jgi:hypothetical protein